MRTKVRDTGQEEAAHIGGFFELEIPKGSGPLHGKAIPLHTGRACLHAILTQKRPTRIHLPFFICHLIVDMIGALGIECNFYEIDESFLPIDLPQPGPDEFLLLVNYFGIQSEFVSRIASEFQGRCIVDNTQAFFEVDDGKSWAFYSARKFFGVPDGAYLYAPEPLQVSSGTRFKPNLSHLVNRLSGLQQIAFRQFHRHESRFEFKVRRMSEVSARLLAAYDYDGVAAIRRSNYQSLHQALASINRLDAALPDSAVPFCYPLLLDRHVSRSALAENFLYVPTFWKEVIEKSTERFWRERELATCLLPLPIDQRYSARGMCSLLVKLEKVGVHSNFSQVGLS